MAKSEEKRVTKKLPAKYKIGDRILKGDSNGNPYVDYTITDIKMVTKQDKTKRTVSGYTNIEERRYEYKCNICGAEHLWKIERLIGTQCSCCTGRVRIKGINTIGDLYPDCLKYFAGDDAFDPNLKSTDRYDAICPLCGGKNETIIDNLTRGHFFCKHCNSIETKRPDLVKHLVNKDDAKLSCCSTKHVAVKCFDCGSEQLVTVNNLCCRGHRCSKCGDNISFPEKFLYRLLKQLGVNFIAQVTSKQLSWCDKYRYDFYIPATSTIIEAHGMQHYTHSFSGLGGRTVEEEQENDQRKENLARQNGIANYIVLDCRNSEIDWEDCAKFATKNMVKEICAYWSAHNDITTSKLATEFNLSANTMRKYLKLGTKCGWCDYSVEKESIKNQQRFIKSARQQGKKVAIFKDGKRIGVFKSIAELSRQSKALYGISLNGGHIAQVCLGERKQHKGFTFKYVNDEQTLDFDKFVA